MQMEWRQVKNEDGSEMIFGGFRVSSLEESSTKANKAVKIIKSYREDKRSHMSLSSEGLVIALHGASKDTITDDDWAIAKEIQKALSD